MHILKKRKLEDSFNNAIDGLIYAIRTEKNMKIHMVIALAVLILCFFFDLTKSELLITTMTITVVIITEMINTAIEFTIDITTKAYNPLAKIAKDVSAGAVFVAALNAVLVGFIIFWDKIKSVNFILWSKVKNMNPYMIFIILIMTCIITLIVKAVYGEGTPLRGGMPSGHSAIAFSIATIIALISNKLTVVILGYLSAIIVAQSRVDSEVHSILEVVIGAIFGTCLTIILFKMLK